MTFLKLMLAILLLVIVAGTTPGCETDGGNEEREVFVGD